MSIPIIMYKSCNADLDRVSREFALKDLKLITSPRDFFQDLIDEVEKEVSYVDFHPLSKNYLSELLVSYIPSENLFTSDENGQKSNKMMAEIWLESQQEDSKTKIRKLKKLADTSLYVSGFFASSLNRKLINPSYYFQIGEMAYSALSKSVNAKEFEEVYKHFSSYFSGYASVLTEVSQKVNIQKDDDLLEAFDRYIDSGSEWAKNHLAKEGVYSYSLKKTSN